MNTVATQIEIWQTTPLLLTMGCIIIIISIEVKVLDVERNYNKRIISEMLYIQQNKQQNNSIFNKKPSF